MTSDFTYVYSDASFSKEHNLAIIGSIIFYSSHEHDTLSLSEVEVAIHQINENNNIRAEIHGVINSLQLAPKNKPVKLYTDCQTVVKLKDRRQKLERTSFISQSKNQILANADLYKAFYKIYDQNIPEIIWLKGHTSRIEATKEQKIFSVLDKQVRDKLRTAISLI